MEFLVTNKLSATDTVVLTRMWLLANEFEMMDALAILEDNIKISDVQDAIQCLEQLDGKLLKAEKLIKKCRTAIIEQFKNWEDSKIREALYTQPYRVMLLCLGSNEITACNENRGTMSTCYLISVVLQVAENWYLNSPHAENMTPQEAYDMIRCLKLPLVTFEYLTCWSRNSHLLRHCEKDKQISILVS